MKTEVHALRVNVKSLAAEARLIREEIRKARNPEAKASLACHRSWRVKPESRLAQLALAYVKGVPYRVVERTAKTPVDSAKLTNKLSRFTNHVDANVVRNWLTMQ